MADDERLSGGDGILSRLSVCLKFRPLDISLLSPVPLSKLGEPAPASDAVEALGRTPYPELRDLGFFRPLSTLLCFDPSRCLLLSGTAGTPSCSFDPEDCVADNGLGGRLVTRGVPVGGKGNWPILAVLRIVLGRALPEAPGERSSGSGVFLSFGTEEAEFAFVLPGVGSPEVVTERTEGMAVRLGVELVRGREAVDVLLESGGSLSASVDLHLVL